MLFTYLLSLNKTRLNLLGNDNISNTSEILYNERVEVFRTLLLNEILYPDLPKAVVSYHNISRAYYIHIPATKDSKEKETYTHNIEQGFICANVFTTLPVKTRVSKISPIGIIAITAFALMMSFVLSAPSVVSMKVLSGVKRLLNWVRKRDREEQTESSEFKTTCVRVYTYISFFVSFACFFVIGEVTLSQSSIISIKEFIDIEDCFVLVPDTFGRKLLESNEFKQTKTMTNKQVMKRMLHLLVNKRDVIEKASDMLEDTANIISSNETLPNGNTYVKARFDLGCDGGQAIEGNVKWSVYPPYAYYAGEEYVKKWTALGKESWHQCTYPSQNDRTRNGVTYTHIIDNKTSTYVVGDGCGFWSDSLSVWRLYGRLEHDIRMSSVTRQRGLYYSNFTNKWVMARLNESGVPIYLVEGKDFKVDYIRNSTYGNKRWSDGIYHFKLSDYYKNNVKGTINNRWCIIPEPPNMDVQTNREVYTWYEARLMNDLYYDIDRNLAWFLTSYPNKYQEDTPWNVATHCHNGRIHEEMPCQVSITINASKEWKEFSPPCKNGIMYKNGPKVIFDSGGVICSIQATNNMQMQTSSTIRLGLETAYMLGATHINCIVNNNESSFSNCSDMNITEYQAINATLVSASNVIELVNYGTTIEYGSNKWDIYTILIIIGIIIIGGILLYVFIRYILPCIIPLICGKCLSKRRKDKKTEEELNP